MKIVPPVGRKNFCIKLRIVVFPPLRANKGGDLAPGKVRLIFCRTILPEG